MIRGLSLCFAVLVAAVPTARAADEKPALEPGNYIVYYSFLFSGYSSPDQALCLLKVEKKGGDLRASSLATAPKLPIEMSDFKVDGRKIQINFDLGGRKLTFEGNVNAKDKKQAFGTFGDDDLISRARLVATDKDKLEGDDLGKKIDLPENFTKARQLMAAVQQAQIQVQRAKGEEAVTEAKKKLDAAEADAGEKAPALFKEVMEKNADSPVVFDAALGLMKTATKSAKPADIRKLVATVEAAADTYGPRFQIDLYGKIADVLKTQKGFSAETAHVAELAGKLMGEKAPASLQVRFEKALLAAYELDGKTDLAKVSAAKLANLEVILDKEYLAKVPPFKPKAFEGRKGKSDRAVVMELFTGAQCPPCVAADVAFDALQKAYKPTDLILIQYHLHIPGPDPLTNDDSEARSKFYTSGGTPATYFNGKSAAGGGGGMSNSETKFKQYRGIIDPLLEEETAIKIVGNVSTMGDKLWIKVEVSGIKEPNENLKLRFVLVEETIKYVGGNNLRFHHQVVRAMPGGADGVALKEKTVVTSIDVSLAEVKANLKKYLAKAEENRPFPNTDRPMDLKHLRLIALVQDDMTKEILQAIQFEVKETK